jgi:hypothetical protein
LESICELQICDSIAGSYSQTSKKLNEQRRIDAYAKHIQDCGPVPGFWKNERIEEIRAQAKANYKVPVIRNVDFSEDKNV